MHFFVSPSLAAAAASCFSNKGLDSEKIQFSFLTARPLPEALHDDVELGEGEDAVLVLVEEHEDLLELGHLLIGELPLGLEERGRGQKRNDDDDDVWKKMIFH